MERNAVIDAGPYRASRANGRLSVALAEVLRSLRKRPGSPPDEELCLGLDLLPLLCLGLEPDAPPAPRRALATYLNALGDNRRLRAAMCDGGRALAAAGIPVIVYKGQDYLDRIYGDLGGREIADVDVLVREADLGTAEQALLAAGLAPDVACRRAHERKWTRGKAELDLHHALRQPVRMRIDHVQMFARSVPCAAARGLRVLEPTDALLVHSIGHTVYGLCVSPSWYVEFQSLLSRANVDVALQRAADYGALAAWYCSLRALACVDHPEASGYAARVPLTRFRRAVLDQLVGFGLQRLGRVQPVRPVRLAVKSLLIDRPFDAIRIVPRWCRWALAPPIPLRPGR